MLLPGVAIHVKNKPMMNRSLAKKYHLTYLRERDRGRHQPRDGLGLCVVSREDDELLDVPLEYGCAPTNISIGKSLQQVARACGTDEKPEDVQRDDTQCSTSWRRGYV
jgi:hypothetical protein